MTGEIDLTAWIYEAHQFENYQDGTAFLIEKHGGSINEYGVFQDGETIELARIGRSSAKAKVARTVGGIWLHGCSTTEAIGGMGDPISVWNRTGYETREDAIDAARGQCRDYFERETRSRNSCQTDSMRAEAAQMVDALTPKGPPPQMSLFDMFEVPALPDRPAPTP